MKMVRLNDKRVIADPCEVAQTLWTRFIGLMGRQGLAQGAGLLIEPCNSIHTFFMRFAIDVVYLDAVTTSRDYKVVSIRRNLRPWRMDFPVFGAKAVLELPSGASADLKEGELLCLS